MNKLGLGLSVLVFGCVTTLAEAAPNNGNVGGQRVGATAGQLPDQAVGHVGRSDVPARSTGGAGGLRADEPKAMPSGPGLQFHRYGRQVAP